jgi:hypothetical protein
VIAQFRVLVDALVQLLLPAGYGAQAGEDLGNWTAALGDPYFVLPRYAHCVTLSPLKAPAFLTASARQ